MNCFDECWNLTERVRGELRCSFLNNREFKDGSYMTHCEHFKFIESCPNCIHHETSVYESGTIDGIGYLCKLQNGKEVFQDVRPLSNNYSDIPKCPIGKFQKE